MGVWNMLTQTREKTQRRVRGWTTTREEVVSGRRGGSLAAAVVFHCSLEWIGLRNGHMITRPRSRRRLWEPAASRGLWEDEEPLPPPACQLLR